MSNFPLHLPARSPHIFIAPDHGPRRCVIGKNGRHLRKCRCNGGVPNLTYYVTRAMKPEIKRAEGKIACRPFTEAKESDKKLAAEAAV
ncbi:hypothetical protein [Burkholderia cenocepacia]|uniref:hypothetical protein n=1 Tax=Burkholderia cenocepacia TaxID=95486 RepID=UPI001F2EE55A|nr:hypothetical protein [Burkholderia cenocepacia]